MGKNVKDKINWLLKYCSEYPGHEYMYDERLDDVNAFNIDLGVEKYILENLNNINLVLLTGDAGDGKSRVLSNLKNVLDSSWIYVNDFSELDENKQKECIGNIYNAIVNKNKKYIVAGNSGIFINAVVQFKYELLNKLKNRDSCLVLNFKNRNIAESTKVFLEVIKEFLNINGLQRCYDCPLCDKCPFLFNLEKLNEQEIIERLRLLFDTLFLKGIHVTFRDLLSVISYFVTKGIDCNQMQSDLNQKLYFFNNIFSYNGSNMLLSEFSEIDIAKNDIYDFDFEVYTNKTNDFEFIITDDPLERLRVIKRYYYFIKPNKLQSTKDSFYKLLPVGYLSEYKELISKIKEITYIDSMDSDLEILRKFELGLNKISNPNHSNAQLVLFDSPPVTAKDVRLVYSSGQQLRLIFCTPEFYFNNGQNNQSNINEEKGLEDLNCFYCFVYSGEQNFEKCPVIKVDYDLFYQIMLAEDNIFTDKNYKLSDNVHIQSFTKAIFDNINSDYNVTVTWTGAKSKSIVDFNMSFIKPSRLETNKNKPNKTLISSISR